MSSRPPPVDVCTARSTSPSSTRSSTPRSRWISTTAHPHLAPRSWVVRVDERDLRLAGHRARAREAFPTLERKQRLRGRVVERAGHVRAREVPELPEAELHPTDVVGIALLPSCARQGPGRTPRGTIVASRPSAEIEANSCVPQPGQRPRDLREPRASSCPPPVARTASERSWRATLPCPDRRERRRTPDRIAVRSPRARSTRVGPCGALGARASAAECPWARRARRGRACRSGRTRSPPFRLARPSRSPSTSPPDPVVRTTPRGRAPAFLRRRAEG